MILAALAAIAAGLLTQRSDAGPQGGDQLRAEDESHIAQAPMALPAWRIATPHPSRASAMANTLL